MYSVYLGEIPEINLISLEYCKIYTHCPVVLHLDHSIDKRLIFAKMINFFSVKNSKGTYYYVKDQLPECVQEFKRQSVENIQEMTNQIVNMMKKHVQTTQFNK